MAGGLVPPLIVLRVVNVHAVMIPGLNRTKPGYGHRMHTKARTTVSVAVGSMALIASLMGCGTDAPARSVGTTTQTPAPPPGGSGSVPGGPTGGGGPEGGAGSIPGGPTGGGGPGGGGGEIPGGPTGSGGPGGGSGCIPNVGCVNVP
ncbi:hypothetical protein MABM_08230 [Mycobacteroides abscessus]|nr:hypothetical protein MABM_08230 [Mycobacteroides abscessus]